LTGGHDVGGGRVQPPLHRRPQGDAPITRRRAEGHGVGNRRQIDTVVQPRIGGVVGLQGGEKGRALVQGLAHQLRGGEEPAACRDDVEQRRAVLRAMRRA
jgi:hypothetical protein